MMARAHGDALLVQRLPDLFRLVALQHERQHARLVLARCRSAARPAPVARRSSHTRAVRARTARCSRCRCASRNRSPRPSPTASAILPVPASKRPGGGWNTVRSNVTSLIMLPPPCHGGMSSSTSRLPYTTPMPVGPNILWPENTKKSASICLHVDPHVRHRLRAVDQRTRAGAMRHRDDLLHRHDRAQRVRHLRHRDDFRAAVEQLLIFVEQHLTRVVDRNHAQLRARLRRELLPRHDVGVMLEVRHDDLVALADVLHAPGLGDQVDAFGRAAHEDDLVGRRRRR